MISAKAEIDGKRETVWAKLTKPGGPGGGSEGRGKSSRTGFNLRCLPGG